MHSARLIQASVRLFSRLYGRGNYQRLCEKIVTMALKEMGIGTVSDMHVNGELALLRTLRAGARIFDVGANTGEFASAVLNEVPSADLHCFEPSSTAFERLQIRAHLNNVALGASPGTLTLYADIPGSQLASMYQRRLQHIGINLVPVELVKVDTVDNYCSKHGIPIIDLLKLDVEGHELAVLQGARSMLSKGAIKSVLFEFGGTDIDSRVFFQDFFYFLTEHRMQIHRLVPPGYLHPITHYKESCEQFAYTNYVAIYKSP